MLSSRYSSDEDEDGEDEDGEDEDEEDEEDDRALLQNDHGDSADNAVMEGEDEDDSLADIAAIDSSSTLEEDFPAGEDTETADELEDDNAGCNEDNDSADEGGRLFSSICLLYTSPSPRD